MRAILNESGAASGNRPQFAIVSVPWKTVLWALVATISLSAASFVALQPGRLGDLHTVREWLAYWIATGANPYTHFAPALDYPPVALLLLRPLAVLPEQGLGLWFLPGAVIVTVLAVWALVQWTADFMRIPLSTTERVTLVAMLVAGGGARSGLWLGQTAALAILLGALSLRWMHSRPVLSGLCLALCAFKLHIGAGFGLAVLLLAGPLVPSIAVVFTVLLSWWFANLVGESLPAIAIDYIRNLDTLYGGPNRVRGMLSIRFVLDDVFGWYSVSTAIYAAMAWGALATVLVLWYRRRRDIVTQTMVAASCLLLSLVFLPHQSYDSALVIPAVLLLMWPESGLIPHPTLRAIAVGAVILYGVIDPSRLIRATLLPWNDSDLVFWLSYNLNPLRPFALFLLVLWRLSQRPVR